MTVRQNDGSAGLIDLGFSDPELRLGSGPWRGVFATARLRRLSAGQVFAYSGSEAGLYYIEEGAIRTFLLSRAGTEKTFCVYGPGAIFGEVNLVDSSPNPWLGVALEDSALRCLNVDEARRLARSAPDLALAVVESLAQKLRMAGKQIGDLSFRTVRSRVACLILARTMRHALEQAVAPPGGPGSVGLTHDEIAEFVGSNRETVTRALREMAAQGFIRYDRSLQNVIVLDRAGLRAEAARES